MKIRTRPYLASILLILAMLILGFAVTAGIGGDIDFAISNALSLRAGQSPQWLIDVIWAISWIGGGVQRYIIVTLLAVALWFRVGRSAGIAMALASLISSILSDVLKGFYGRLRPDLIPHLDLQHSAAYPSGHATSAAVVYILFALLMPKAQRPAWLAVALVFTLLTGLSRVMLGVHWASDVIGGWMLGTAFAMGAYALMLNLAERNQIIAR